jgi:Flp pilus assembly protein TadD
LRRAVELDPDYAPAHYWYSNLLALTGRRDESLREAATAAGLDPYSPLSAMNYGRTLYYARRYEEAAAQFRGVLAQNPGNRQSLHMTGLVLAQQGRYGEAVEALEKLYAVDELYAAAALGYSYAKAGRPDDAARMLRRLDAPSAGRPTPPQEKALVYIGLGDRDAAFSYLEAAAEERVAGLAYLTTDPVYDDLRPDPRFDELARRLKLTP